MDAEKRLRELRALLQEYSHRYYVLDDPLIADGEYDFLFQELLGLEEEHPELITADSPSQRPGGAPLDKFEQVVHRVPMLSLENAFNAADLHSFEDRLLRFLNQETATVDQALTLSYMAEPKIDGLAVELVYEQGRLLQGSTRGDGSKGEDITAQLKTIPSIPRTLQSSAAQRLEIRGEVFMDRQALITLNQERLGNGPVCQSAQCRGRVSPSARSGHHRQAIVEISRLWHCRPRPVSLLQPAGTPCLAARSGIAGQ